MAGADNSLPSIYPNPSNGQFTINIPAQEADIVNITINDLNGSEIYSNNFVGAVNNTINLTNVANGTYIVTFTINGVSQTEKIIINK